MVLIIFFALFVTPARLWGELRDELSPKISITFDPNDPSCKSKHKVQGPFGTVDRIHNITYSVRVENSGRKTIRSVMVYLRYRQKGSEDWSRLDLLRLHGEESPPFNKAGYSLPPVPHKLYVDVVGRPPRTYTDAKVFEFYFARDSGSLTVEEGEYAVEIVAHDDDIPIARASFRLWLGPDGQMIFQRDTPPATQAR